MMETTGREQMVDVIAQQLGIDPLEFRRRNVISRAELPYTSAMLDRRTTPSARPRCLEQAAELIGYEQFRKDQERARAEGRLVGIGLSLYIEPQRGVDLGAPTRPRSGSSPAARSTCTWAPAATGRASRRP